MTAGRRAKRQGGAAIVHQTAAGLQTGQRRAASCQIDDHGHLRLELLVRIWLDRIGKHRLTNLLARALDLLLEPAGIGRRLHRLDEKAGVETAQFRIRVLAVSMRVETHRP